MRVSFDLYEPMLFRGPMEFSPDVRGPKTIAESLVLPTPSTVAGALATLLVDIGRAGIPPLRGRWDEQFSEILGPKLRLKGPYLIREGGNRGLLVEYRGCLIELNKLTSFLPKVDLKETLKSEKKSLEKMFEDHNIYCYKPALIERVGIKLVDSKKSVKEGALYTTRMVDYSKLEVEGSGEPSTLYSSRDMCIGVDVLNADTISDLNGKTYTIRFGGEGRVSRVSFTMGDALTSNVVELLRDFEEGGAYLYLITYALFRSDPSCAQLHEVETGAFLSPSIWKKLEESIRGVTLNAELEYVIGKCHILGGGYSLAREMKKPIYAALPPGTIIKLKKIAKNHLLKIYEEGISEIAGRMGYGTVIPIPRLT